MVDVARCRAAGYWLLPIEAGHTVVVEGLPLHHEDPFDRLIVAQSLTESLRSITHDRQVARHSDTILLV